MTTSPTLRDRIAEALISWTYRGKEPDPEAGILETVRANAYSRADAVLAVLPATVDRAAVLHEEADRIDATRADFPIAVQNGITWATAELRRHAAEVRRVADETAAAERRCTCGETACESELCDCDSTPCPMDHAAGARQDGEA